MKRCNKCKSLLDLKEFWNRKESKDGKAYSCKSCIRAYRLKNKEKIFNQKREYRERNKDKISYNFSIYRKNNFNKLSSRYKEYYQENKVILKKKKKIYRSNNKHKANANTAKRRAARINATPKWLTKEHKDDILQIYKDCEDIQWLSEERFEVDHIVPLRGDKVCGLHVPWNLQILTEYENRSKGNKF